MASSPRSLTARQRYDAPAALVFEAFTDPLILPRWFSPGPAIAMDVLAHELRPGGRYRFRYRQSDGTISIVAGEFLEIAPPERLVFTWTWEEPDPHAGVKTLVTVAILDREPGSEVVVTHERFPDEESRMRHDEGWRSTLARLVTR